MRTLTANRLMLLVAGLEPARDCSRRILSPLRLPIPPHQQGVQIPNGWRWIRTTEAICSRFTVCPLWPLGNPSTFHVVPVSYIILLFKLQEIFHRLFGGFKDNRCRRRQRYFDLAGNNRIFLLLRIISCFRCHNQTFHYSLFGRA